MITGNYTIKLQACNLCDALHRNINDDFKNISFDIDKNNHIQIKIILNKGIKKYREELEDISVEFSALQTTDCVKPFIVALFKDDNSPLENVIYRQREKKGSEKSKA